MLSNVDTTVGWELTYCFTAVCVGLLLDVGVDITPITKVLLLKLFYVAYFFFPRSLSFDFCYDLDLLTLRAFFVVICFSTIFSNA